MQLFRPPTGTEPPTSLFVSYLQIKGTELMTSSLRLFRLTPSASLSDPRWLDQQIPGEIIVRAHSPADARIVASQAEIDFPDINAKPSHGIGTRFASCFRDEKLYSVEEMQSDALSSDGPREIVSGSFKTDVIKHA